MARIISSTSWKIIAAVTILSFLITTIELMPITEAASLTSTKDTVSDSSPSANDVTHSFDFIINQNIPANGSILITFDSNFDLSGVGSSDVTCPGGGSVATTSQTVECSTSTAITATSALQVIIEDVDSPSKTNATGVADTYIITVQTRNASDGEIENARVMVAIIETVTMTALVNPTLEFKISGLATSTVINTVTTTIGTTTTTIPFGTVNAGAVNSKIGGQEMKVTTNATYGFVVTAEQDHNLQSAASADIDSFDDGVAATTTKTWESPTGTLGAEDTFGHMGFTSNDANLSSDGSYPDFSGAKFGGFNGSSTFVVFAHNGPSDGLTPNMGFARIAYKIELTPLQEAGDYTNTLMYICTPTF
jgi:hypothetical protein